MCIRAPELVVIRSQCDSMTWQDTDSDAHGINRTIDANILRLLPNFRRTGDVRHRICRYLWSVADGSGERKGAAGP
jgi:hypothetical protein